MGCEKLSVSHPHLIRILSASSSGKGIGRNEKIVSLQSQTTNRQVHQRPPQENERAAHEKIPAAEKKFQAGKKKTRHLRMSNAAFSETKQGIYSIETTYLICHTPEQLGIGSG